MIRLGVVGWPVSHSRSPAIHNAALRATGLGDRWHYQLLPVAPDLFRETVLALPAAGFRGVNVTIPHKEAALGLATEGSSRAAAIGAANTLVFEETGRIVADNTDAPALIQEIGERTQIRGASTLVLGAGGSARAAVWALLDAGAAEVLIWNRTPERARRLAAEMGARAVAEPPQETDILINCTSAGLQTAGQLEDLLPPRHRLERHRAVVDLVYREGGTPLIRAARERGVPTVDGLEMLIAQGAIAFERFTGKAPPTEAMRAAVGLSSAS